MLDLYSGDCIRTRKIIISTGGDKMGYRRSQERKKRLKRLYNKTWHSYGSGVWYDEKRDRYIRYSPSDTSKYPKYLRNQSNRKIRRYKGKLNGGSYKKAFDYWWMLY